MEHHFVDAFCASNEPSSRSPNVLHLPSGSMEEQTVTYTLGQEARESKQRNSSVPPILEAAEFASAPDGKKRKPGKDVFQNSDYFKIRALVKELRPLFMEVLHSSDFINSRAAYQIKMRMNTVMELTKKITGQKPAYNPDKAQLQPFHLPGEMNAEEKVELKRQTAQPQTFEIPTLEGSTGSAVAPQKIEPKIIENPGSIGPSIGTFVVGGSPVGWNFLLYPGTKPVYYGRTKEKSLAGLASNEQDTFKNAEETDCRGHDLNLS